ncbi:MAG: ABC transporter ATP-binding protein [Chloroflexota bacterium]
MAQPLLEVKDLKVHFPTDDGLVKAVDGVSYSLQAGETLGIVGESGSGKSVSSLTVMGLITPKQANITGEVFFQGQDLLKVPKDEMRTIRGAKISMIFQDPMTSLHPFYKVGYQIAEAILEHQDISKNEAFDQAVEMLARVNIPHPKDRANQYPHEFSGGMRQRAMIAMALACDPAIVIGDEPTTALDVMVQAQILALLEDLRAKLGLSLILITHDLSVIAETCDRVMVMYAGRVAEEGPVSEVFTRPRHPYTRKLLAAFPNIHADRRTLEVIPGSPPDLRDPPPGCRFAPRCSFAMDVCSVEVPPDVTFGDVRVACHLFPAGSDGAARDDEARVAS